MSILTIIASITTILFLAAIVGNIADKKGHNAYAYYILAVFLPLISLIIVIILAPNDKVLERKKIENGDSKLCPYCNELVKLAAIKCKHCGSQL